ncbi:MAG TPA: phospho-N-acetylmuramoyl-pentapeptide-transferase [Clostridia bacterium]|nr:phospho-N-acetylmuramoyl-pentapeptide-transferase [Clostridia bacterium]
MHRMLWAVLIGFAATLLVGPAMIRLLRRLKLGQQVYELAPKSHQSKQGVPTMAGLMFAGVSILVAFVLRVGAFDYQSDFMLVLAAFSLLNLLIGFVDDMLKIRRKKNQGGLRERSKVVAQILISLAFSLYCYFHPQVGSSIVVPFFNVEWDLGIYYMPVMMFAIICTTNASNLLDGLDGLLGGVSLSVMATMGLFALFFAGMLSVGAQQDNLLNLAIFCTALVGSLMGYLRYNMSPAQMLMGDTGSMYIGAVFVGAAMLLRLPLLIPIAGFMMVWSLLSTFIQRMYFKATHGKRIFKNSPYHHHLEMSGTPETRIVSMYALITILLCLLCFLAVPAGL